MKLYLLRHGPADTPGGWNGDDAQRSLSPEGQELMRAAALGLNYLDLGIDGLLTSPLTRCRQTAQIVGEALGIEPVVSDELAPGFDLQRLAVVLSRGSWRHVMLCGHEPDMGILAGTLIGGDRRPARVHMRKGACCALSLPRPDSGARAQELAGSAELESLWNPGELALLGQSIRS